MGRGTGEHLARRWKGGSSAGRPRLPGQSRECAVPSFLSAIGTASDNDRPPTQCCSGSSHSLLHHPVHLGGPPPCPAWALRVGRPGALGPSLPPGRRSLPNRLLGRGLLGATSEETENPASVLGKTSCILSSPSPCPWDTSCAHACPLSAVPWSSARCPPPRPAPGLPSAPLPWPRGLLHGVARVPPLSPRASDRPPRLPRPSWARGSAYWTRRVRVILAFRGHCPLVEEASLAFQAFQHRCPGARLRQAPPQASCDFLSDV